LFDVFDINRNLQVPLENRYYGPYNELLRYALKDFPFIFTISPQASPAVKATDDYAHETVDFVIFNLVVSDRMQNPVFFLEIKDDSWANSSSLRMKADEQIRLRFHEMLPRCTLPYLYGLSCLGTSIRVYRGDQATKEVTPDVVERPKYARRKDLLGGEWSVDILSLEGLKIMQKIISYCTAHK
jgi:hypothetical protein